MKAHIRPGRPPNFLQIVKVFPKARGNLTLFAYADTIYVSSNSPARIPDFLVAHECVHLERQGWNKEGAKEWWDKYLTDEDFRYNEEVLGHRAEYERIIRYNTSEKFRIKVLESTTKRLTNPLYKFNVSKEQAMLDLLGAEECQKLSCL